MPSLQQTRRKTLTRQPRPQSGSPTICGSLEMLINLVADTDHMWITPNVRMSRSHADAWSRSRMDNSSTNHALSTYVVLWPDLVADIPNIARTQYLCSALLCSACWVRHKPGAPVPAAQGLRNTRCFGNKHSDSRIGGNPRGRELGLGSPGANPGITNTAEFDPRKQIAIGNLRDALRPRQMWRSRVQSVNIGEQDQEVSINELRHKRRETVIVTEPNFVGCNGVIFVHNREDPKGEEAIHRATGINTVSRVVEVTCGEQHLPRRYPVPIKRNLIPHDESRLSHGCRGLLCCKVGGSLIQLQIRQPCRDGTRGHKNDLRTSPVRTGKGVDEKVNVGGVDASDGG